MSRAKKYEKRGSLETVKPDDQALEEPEEIRWALKRKEKKPLESDRLTFVENAIRLNEEIENQRKKKTNEIMTRAKNILQSLVYLVLNEDFYTEIEKARKNLGIPESGFHSKKRYEVWAIEYGKKNHPNRGDLFLMGQYGEEYFYSFGYKAVEREAELIVRKRKLCFEKDVINLVPAIYSFMSRSLKFEEFFPRFYSIVCENALYCKTGGELNDRFMPGFDVTVVELENSKSRFFTNQWSYKLFPFTRITNIRELFRDFFKRNFYYEKDIKDFDPNYLEMMKKEFDAEKNRNKIKKAESLKISDEKDYILLTFTTNFFTKPSDVINLCRKEKKKIGNLLKSKENKVRDFQKLHLGEEFERNCKIYTLGMVKSGIMGLHSIADEVFGEPVDVIPVKGNLTGFYNSHKHKDIPTRNEKKDFNSVKGELGKFKAKIRDILKRKIVF